MEKKMSIKDIAAEAGVSTATVSRVFRETGYVNQETRELILKIAQEKGYAPKQYKHRTPNTNPLVGVIVADLNNVFFRLFYDRLSEVLNEEHVNVVLCNSGESAQKEIQYLDMFRQMHVNGVIISPVSEIPAYNAEFLKSMKDDGIPVILFDRDIKGTSFDGVFQDNLGGALSAVNTLIEQGHTHIATIAGPLSAKPGLDRLNGYLEAMRSHNLPIRQEYICYGDFRMQSGYDNARTLLRNYPRITAIFCANNLMAVGALRAIRDAGLSVPKDIALISFGSLVPFDLYNDSPITAVVQPVGMMGEECGEMMIQELTNSNRRRNRPARRITLETSLELRGSEFLPTGGRNKGS